MANTWNAHSIQLLTQPELKRLLSVMTSTRDQALLLLAYRHGLRGCLASLFEAFLLLRLAACAACIPKHEIIAQSLPLRGESHLSVQNRSLMDPAFWHIFVHMICLNHTV
jgi:hypothetical protein